MNHRPIRTRDDALDALRGIAVFGMVLVNLQGDDRVAFPLLAHAEWTGLTIADLVFPLFLLALGLALPLSLDGRIPRVGVGRIVRRAVLLWLIGFAIGWIVHASTHLVDIRFTGVLERIAIVYLFAALTVRATRTWHIPAAVAGVLMLIHGVLLYMPPPDGIASMAPGMGFSG
ncbi:heparan-alpha-glucosaminide N-acetyltransferase domain-containing protein [Sphingomonas sp.]|jgi:predicted acyltransferase|uniref:heparan-alpha-glucosaminide N-acetyltransferase domain-containing protein n=1 Tax=Sphingomonas sp. TaxID=28214 RepID=UPI002E31DC86|nr:heparan-alpha-glucosaminide N-acetyltransferase domain-containing protein [Sphingomonas sp.]HEX4695263.1 heparan-alpha-glucosaminide N-acetyltransferase domain-containing protein [Sphingomonas sp.]